MWRETKSAAFIVALPTFFCDSGILIGQHFSNFSNYQYRYIVLSHGAFTLSHRFTSAHSFLPKNRTHIFLD
jgi:hypothetical protein